MRHEAASRGDIARKDVDCAYFGAEAFLQYHHDHHNQVLLICLSLCLSVCLRRRKSLIKRSIFSRLEKPSSRPRSLTLPRGRNESAYFAQMQLQALKPWRRGRWPMQKCLRKPCLQFLPSQICQMRRTQCSPCFLSSLAAAHPSLWSMCR